MNILLDSNTYNDSSWYFRIVSYYEFSFLDSGHNCRRFRGYILFLGLHQNAPCNSKYFRNRNRFKLQFIKCIEITQYNELTTLIFFPFYFSGPISILEGLWHARQPALDHRGWSISNSLGSIWLGPHFGGSLGCASYWSKQFYFNRIWKLKR